MRNVVFSLKNFIIVKQYEDKYMVVNLDKKFKNGHTHVNNLQYAKLLVLVILEKKIKNKKHQRLLKNERFKGSIVRLSSNEKLQEIIRRSN